MSESYSIGGTHWALCDDQKHASQSFTPLETHNLYYIDLETRSAWWQPRSRIELYKADGNHLPTGFLLSASLAFTPRTTIPWMKYRTRFAMRPYLLEKDIEYCIVLRGEGPWPLSQIEWLYDPDDGAYPRGIRAFRHTLGEPWEPFPNDDHIFIEFGEPPMPPPPPDPPIPNFTVLTIEQILTLTGYKIITTTNVPCHLWMRWSTTPPRIHRIPRTTRGLTTLTDFYYCFVVYEDNEQQEPGDTVYHTFIKEPWPACETRWFYFWGTIDDKTSPSTSGLFHKHRKAPPAPPEIEYCHKITDPHSAYAGAIGWLWAVSLYPFAPFMLTAATTFAAFANHTDHDLKHGVRCRLYLGDETHHIVGPPLAEGLTEVTIPPGGPSGEVKITLSPVVELTAPHYWLAFGFDILPEEWDDCYCYLFNSINDTCYGTYYFNQTTDDGDTWQRIYGRAPYYRSWGHPP